MIGLGLLAIVLVANYYGPILWAVVVLLTSLLAYEEFKLLCKNLDFFPQNIWIYFFVTLLILIPLLLPHHASDTNLVYSLMLTVIIAAYVIIFPRILLKGDYMRFEDITSSFWAVFQFGLLPSFFTWIRLMEHGYEYTLIMILTVSANDIGSLLFGRAFGRTKLAPQISPNKTIVGSIGGLLTAALAFYFMIQFWNIELGLIFDTGIFGPLYRMLGPGAEFIVLFVLGLLLAIVAQIGDLLVSALKRAAGVKDTGNLLLSHGGVLDRVDSHFFAIWFAYFIFAYLLG